MKDLSALDTRPPKIARFAIIDDERGLLLGQDLGNVFEKGIVYEVTEMMGEFIIRKKGEYALPKSGSVPCEGSEANVQIGYALHLITKDEAEKHMAGS